MTNKITTTKPENAYQRAKNLIAYLHKIGQIMKMPTEKEMKEYWDKVKSSK